MALSTGNWYILALLLTSLFLIRGKVFRRNENNKTVLLPGICSRKALKKLLKLEDVFIAFYFHFLTRDLGLQLSEMN